ncbi:MAG TPA: RHS repeat-associated core domain-containing protein [Edaphobacter sp.]|uniref:RHS repeat-associated core domain-containing protein n=1 Tax=Edaphobacter sp. TaxID=1934404 RepID=UPI002B9D1718|nr:RHS repeat-associated core domain-containing protein [Edaphobacter sp.]HUZ95953.1 RHS repeat-associated core domain-containing protein [Edaphobacter sp.]
MQLASGVFPGSNPASAAMPQLAANSRRGFGLLASTSQLGSGFAISSSTLGFSESLYDGDVRPRSTGKERDTESGNDYFGARYYASSMGRFLSPDWSAKVEPVPYAKLDDPQSLNLYSYTRNNPMTRNDFDGHTPEDRVKKALELSKEDISYKFGGGHAKNADPKSGLDCSGMTNTVFKSDPDNKLTFADSKGNFTAASEKSTLQEKGEFSSKLTDARPGDAIFFAKGKSVDHTGVVTSIDSKGRIHFVDAPHHGAKVRENILYNGKYGSESFAGVGRPKEAQK